MKKGPSRRGSGAVRARSAGEVATAARLLAEIRPLIDSARRRVAQSVNAELVMLYWNVGDRIRRGILMAGRAG